MKQLKQQMPAFAEAFQDADISAIVKLFRDLGYQIRKTYYGQSAQNIAENISYQEEFKDINWTNMQLLNDVGVAINNCCVEYPEQYGDSIVDILGLYRTGWYVFACFIDKSANQVSDSAQLTKGNIAEVEHIIRQDVVQTLSTIDQLDKECRLYQDHLLQQIGSYKYLLQCDYGAEPAYLHKSSQQVPLRIHVYKNIYPEKSTGLQAIADKYNTIQILKEKLHNPSRTIVERLKDFNADYKRPGTQKTITAQRDSTGMKFLLAVGIILTGVLPGVIALAVRSKLSCKNSWNFWQSHGANLTQKVDQCLVPTLTASVA